MEDNREFYLDEIFKKFQKTEGFQIKRTLGKGTYGIVKLIAYKNRIFAAKLVEKEKYDEIEYIKDLVGPHIVKIEKICQPINEQENNYYMIIMEKGDFVDLSKFIRNFQEKNILKLIYPKCIDENISDTILKFFARQIIDGMMTLYQYNYVHFDIKPENILVFKNLKLKIIDFDLLKKISDNVKEFKIPGGTLGYTTREYLLREKVNAFEARSQDYFALGCTLFLLKYGFPLLKYNNRDDKEMQADEFIKLLDKNINYIQSYKTADKDFITFIINLINLNPNKRLKFEEIHRNKWLNKNVDKINIIVEDYEKEKDQLILNLQIQDFFSYKNKIFEFNHPSQVINKKNRRYTRKCFNFKKKVNDNE